MPCPLRWLRRGCRGHRRSTCGHRGETGTPWPPVPVRGGAGCAPRREATRRSGSEDPRCCLFLCDAEHDLRAAPLRRLLTAVTPATAVSSRTSASCGGLPDALGLVFVGASARQPARPP